MKIIALSCSPAKNRNSDMMLDYFIKGIKSIDGMEVEKIYLKDISIDYYSYENSKGISEHENDFKKLALKLSQDDIGLVIATPTYNFSVPAHLKNFIDRIRFMALDFSKKNKIRQPLGKLSNIKTYFLVSGGTPNWAERILFFAYPAFWLRGVFLYFGAKFMGSYYSGDIKTFENHNILNICFKKGKKYAEGLIKKHNPNPIQSIFWGPPQEK